MLTLFASIGRKSHVFFQEVYAYGHLCNSACYWLFLAPFRGRRGLRSQDLAREMVSVGNRSLGIVALVGASIGAVLALQAAYQLKIFGATMYTGALVSVSVTRELGPIITAIVISGRIGAAIAAELGTMKVQEEIDALITMGIPPIPFIVVPKILAILIMLPCLTIIVDILSMVGGYLIGVLSLGIPSGLYIKASFEPLVAKDILTGLGKSFFFALLIGLISVRKGFSVQGGADEVGRATTETVVLSIISIIFADCLFTAIFYYAFP